MRGVLVGRHDLMTGPPAPGAPWATTWMNSQILDELPEMDAQASFVHYGRISRIDKQGLRKGAIPQAPEAAHALPRTH
jgi:hypothetical protein